jgi:putative transposase
MINDKFKGKYRIPSARLQSWDYGCHGAYFLTICTHNRVHYFGEIVEGGMQLTELGKLAEKYWLEIPQYFKFIELGNLVVMPNHIHGILILDRMKIEESIEDEKDSGLVLKGVFAGNKSPLLNDNISKIIRWYKGRCSFEIRKIDNVFRWQTRFYDNIITDGAMFEKVQSYIVNNPSKWHNDKLNNQATSLISSPL